MSFKKLIKKLKNIPIIIEVIKILINLSIKSKLKLNKFSFFNKINKRIALNQEDIEVAIGMMMKPISLKKRNIFNFNLIFIDRFIRILVTSALMGIFFSSLIHVFSDKLLYEETFKSAYLVGTVMLGLTFYILVAILIKAFKISDIHLKY